MALLSATATPENSQLRLVFKASGDTFGEALSIIKSIQGRHFDPITKTWTIPDNAANRTRLAEYGFSVKGETQLPAKPIMAPKAHSHIQDWASLHIDPTPFPKLFKKQIGDLRFFTWAKGNALLVGEVGYGKTVSGLSWLKLMPALRPTVIVTRANIKKQWQKQWRTWVNDNTIPEILLGETPRALSPAHSYIINREILHFWFDSLAQINPKCIIGDECQDFGNDKMAKTEVAKDKLGNVILDDDGQEVKMSGRVNVRRTKAFVELCRLPSVESRIFLSATPFNTRVQQFFTVLNLLMPKTFSNKWIFQQRYCDPKPGLYGGWDFSGASNLEELHRLASPCMLFRDRDRENKCRLMQLVLDTDMSAKDRQGEIQAISDWDIGGDFTRSLEDLEELAASQFKYKRKSVFQWIKGMVDNGEKLLVFGRHRAVLESIANALGKKGVLYYGGMSERERERSIEAFTKGTAMVLAANIEAAGVGLDGLQHCCHRVAFAEIITSPSAVKQCIGRVDRTGQTKDVDAHFLVGDGSSDALAMMVLQENWGILDAIRHGTPWDEKAGVIRAIGKFKARESKKTL